MAKAYICIARNDLADNLLQVLDLWPNTSQRNPTIDPPGQTEYVTWEPQHDVLTIAASTAGPLMGLQAYMWDNVEDNTNGPNTHLTFARCTTIANGILAAQGLGTALTLAAIDALIVGATGGAPGSSGLTVAHSTGAVEDVLRICAGEVYYLPTGSVAADGANWPTPHYRSGYFLDYTAVGNVTCVAPNVGDTVVIGGVVFTAAAVAVVASRVFSQAGDNTADAASLALCINDWRNQALIANQNNGVTVTAEAIANVVYLTASVPGVTGELTLTGQAVRLPVSAAALDWVSGGYRGHRDIVDTGMLHISCLTGALSHLKAATYSWINPAFTYGATGTALAINGTTHILAAGVWPAVVVYDASGNVL